MLALLFDFLTILPLFISLNVLVRLACLVLLVSCGVDLFRSACVGCGSFFLCGCRWWFCRRVVVLDRFIQENSPVTSGGS